MKNSLKRSLVRYGSAGFTLTEILIAASIGSIVIGAAGFGLVTMAGNSKTATAKVDGRTEIHRATEFISNEIRRANNIESPADATAALSDVDSFKSGFSASLPANTKAVLALDVPGVDEEVIYFVADKVSPWEGPKVVYRFGPDLNASGEYTNANNPSSWQVQPLIDKIDETQVSNTWTCPNGGNLSPSSNGAGFYACVSPDGNVAQLYLNGAIEVANKANEVYQANTQAFARADDAPPLAAAPAAFTSASLPLFSVNNGSLTVNNDATLKFEVLGGAIQCSGSKPPLSVTTKLTLNGQPMSSTMSAGDSLTLPPGSANTVEVSSTATGTSGTHGCNYSFTTNSTNTNQVYALKNGDPVPDIAPMYNQSQIDDFLQNYIQDGKVTIEDNQVIYLFELGTTNKNSSAYDLQDNVVLVTIDAD